MKIRTIDLSFIALLALIILMASSCSVNRHAVKSSLNVTEESTVNSEVKTTTEDKTKTVITENCTDTVATPGVKIQSESAGTSTKTVINGDTLKAVYDPLTNTTKAEYTSTPKKIPVNKEKRTEISNDIKTATVVKSDSTGKTEIKKTDKDVTQKTSWIWLWVVIGFAILLAAVLIYLKFVRK